MKVSLGYFFSSFSDQQADLEGGKKMCNFAAQLEINTFFNTEIYFRGKGSYIRLL